ncbi:hypothetical protein MLD38_039517 [Melastoma candidum]|uniref:Uncharacterized protein n=1 Tax=Melastoma candidum TaxID=119954 RepID=A0ACB9L2A9_9MYRT|nr:hypothetical protein MLD38_039517 [Melastoma candidum]
MNSVFRACPFPSPFHPVIRNAACPAPIPAMERRKLRSLSMCRGHPEPNLSLKRAERERRCADYDQNIWHDDFIETLGKTKTGVDPIRVERLKQDTLCMFSGLMDSTRKLELIDCIVKLGLSDIFRHQIMEALHELAAASQDDANNLSVYHAALRFRLLLQFGYDVSQDLKDRASDSLSGEPLVELLEASNLAREGEDELDAVWFDVRWQIDVYERSADRNSILLELAKHNFNMLQAIHQEDLKAVSRWWKDLGLMQHLDFVRDRPVESFFFALGVTPEPEAKSLRRSLAKVVAMLLVIYDVYDIFGSLEELRCFTRTIKMWDSDEVEPLPKCFKVCFRALDDVTNQIARECGKEADLDRVLLGLRKAWANFCEGMFVEAKWDKTGHIPTMEEYLGNAWVTSSSPLILSHAYHFLSGDRIKDASMQLDENKDIIRDSSIIFRLSNDLRTSVVSQLSRLSRLPFI